MVRAINAGEGSPTPAKWQGQYTAGYRESRLSDCDQLIGIDRLLADSMTRARLHRLLTREQFFVVLIRYGSPKATDDKKNPILFTPEQQDAVCELALKVGTNAGTLFRRHAITSWALPAAVKEAEERMDIKGVYNWDGQDVTDTTLRRWRSAIRTQLREWLDKAFQVALPELIAAGLVEEAT